MKAQTEEYREYGFILGLTAGTLVAAGLAIWLVPRSAAEFRRRMSDSARRLGVARGAHEVEHYAPAVRSGPAETNRHSAADRSASRSQVL